MDVGRMCYAVLYLCSVVSLLPALADSDGSGAGRYRYPHHFSFRGPKGMRGPAGPPGKCPSYCGETCVMGAQGILEGAKIDENGVLKIDSLKETVKAANMTAEYIESGMKSVEDLSAAEANGLYVYLMFKNSICDVSLLSAGPPDLLMGEKGQKGERGERGQRGLRGEIGAQGEIGPQGEPGEKGEKGEMGQKGEMGTVGEKGDTGESGPVGNTGGNGLIGPEGRTGAPGPPGPAGPAGADGLIGEGGVTIINWGESTCPPQADLLYKGTVVQTVSPGGKLQCLQEVLSVHSFSVPSKHLSQVRTLFYSNSRNTMQSIPCAVCYLPKRTAKFLNLGAMTCPVNWTREYQGALATLHYEFFADSICINENLLSDIEWEQRGYNHVNDLNLVVPQCDTKPCMKGQIPCALCTR